jgi:hypothetical protein
MAYLQSRNSVHRTAELMQVDLVRQIATFVRSDPVLYSNYLLHYEDIESGRDTAESYCFFLLWFLLAGRSSFARPLVISARLREAVAFPDADGRHMLMEYVLGTTVGRIADREQALARYYFHAVPKFRLGPLLSTAEIVSMQHIAPFARLARLAVDIKDGDGGAKHQAGTLLDQLQRLSYAGAVDNLPCVSIVGFHRSVLGIGEDARSLFECLLEVGIRPELIDVSYPGLEPFERAGDYSAFETSYPHGSVVIFCMPVFEMMRLLCARGFIRASLGQYWIGYWPWETSALQPGWVRAAECVDEVWASSKFTFEAYTRQIEKPISLIPLNVHLPTPVEPRAIGALFGSKFTFLSVFDFLSGMERKNPIGAISAFRLAFPGKTENVQLILKTTHAHRRPEDFNAIRAAIDEDERIVVVDGSLEREEVSWLIEKSQALLSLHRSEGFGRPLAEAMLLGVPVIATGWSGSSDFLNDETGFPIRYRLRAVGHKEYPFAAGEWAEPDVEHAAAVMRDLYRRGGADSHLTLKARQTVTTLFSRSSVGKKLVERLTAIECAQRDVQRGLDRTACGG